MPPAKVEITSRRIPAWLDDNRPLLVMPPLKVDTEERTMASPPEIVPLLAMPPDTTASLSIRIPSPDCAVMVPRLETAPPTLALLMVIPVAVGGVVPLVVIVPVPVLVTLPVTVALLKMLMQVMAAELVTAGTVPPLCVRHDAANADGAPPPIRSAATDDDANRAPNRTLATVACRGIPHSRSAMRSPHCESRGIYQPCAEMREGMSNLSARLLPNGSRCGFAVTDCTGMVRYFRNSARSAYPGAA